jgi:hypothetical protein
MFEVASTADARRCSMCARLSPDWTGSLTQSLLVSGSGTAGRRRWSARTAGKRSDWAGRRRGALRSYEPKRLRLRILAVAGRTVHTARRRILHIDPAWPWADAITTAHRRLCALPAP